MVTLGGIIGADLSTNKALATLPLSVMVIAVAASTIPATLLMRKNWPSQEFFNCVPDIRARIGHCCARASLFELLSVFNYRCHAVSV